MKNTVKIENLGPFLSRSLFPRNFGVFWNSGKLGILEFRKNFPGKIWMRSREFEETRIFLHFYLFCRREFPGILEKGYPRFRRKLEIVVDIFRGKIWFFTSRISGNTYILAFLHVVLTTIPGNFRKGGPRFSWKFEILEGPGKFGIFGISGKLLIF